MIALLGMPSFFLFHNCRSSNFSSLEGRVVPSRFSPPRWWGSLINRSQADKKQSVLKALGECNSRPVFFRVWDSGNDSLFELAQVWNKSCRRGPHTFLSSSLRSLPVAKFFVLSVDCCSSDLCTCDLGTRPFLMRRKTPLKLISLIRNCLVSNLGSDTREALVLPYVLS